MSSITQSPNECIVEKKNNAFEIPYKKWTGNTNTKITSKYTGEIIRV